MYVCVCIYIPSVPLFTENSSVCRKIYCLLILLNVTILHAQNAKTF